VFYEHDGSSGKTRDLESVQYVVRNGWHHLFFVEQDLSIENHPTSHMVATDPTGWSMAARTVVDAGWAPEIKRFDAEPESDVFARLAKYQDPRDESWFITVRFDSVRFDDGGQTPVVLMTDPLAARWATRSGAAGDAAPTFGDNGMLRDDPFPGVEGNGWFSSIENYGGPLSGVGQPGAALGDTATGRLESRPFTITGGHLRIRLGGGVYPATCYVALLDDNTGLELSRISANTMNSLEERFWDLGPWLERTVRLAIVDDEQGIGGWIAVDGIEERSGGLAPAGDHIAWGDLVMGLEARPNPFNPRTVIRFEMPRTSTYRIVVHDVGGRRVWQTPETAAPGGAEVKVVWNGRDQTGRALASGKYLGRVLVGGVPLARLPLMLLR